MMRMPDTLPMHLMLAMMQSGILPSAYTPWSNSFASFMPEWMRPKSPLEQASEQMQNLWADASQQWQTVSQEMLSPWLNASNQFAQDLQENPNAGSKASSSTSASSPRRRGSMPWEGASVETWIPAFAGMTAGADASDSTSGNPNHFDWSSFATDFFNPDFLASLSTEAYNRSTGFLQGVQAYLASDYERPEKEYDMIWERGSATLLDCAPEATDAVAVLCVPSLINRSTVLDLYPEVSFVDFLKSRGFRPLILDWGSPNADEMRFRDGGLHQLLRARCTACVT